MAWMVFPRPISSASIPFKPWDNMDFHEMSNEFNRKILYGTDVEFPLPAHNN
jgi:hypothetical protein